MQKLWLNLLRVVLNNNLLHCYRSWIKYSDGRWGDLIKLFAQIRWILLVGAAFTHKLWDEQLGIIYIIPSGELALNTKWIRKSKQQYCCTPNSPHICSNLYKLNTISKQPCPAKTKIARQVDWISRIYIPKEFLLPNFTAASKSSVGKSESETSDDLRTLKQFSQQIMRL